MPLFEDIGKRFNTLVSQGLRGWCWLVGAHGISWLTVSDCSLSDDYEQKCFNEDLEVSNDQIYTYLLARGMRLLRFCLVLCRNYELLYTLDWFTLLDQVLLINIHVILINIFQENLAMLFQLLVLLLHLLTSEYHGALLLISAQSLSGRDLWNGVGLFFTLSLWLDQILLHWWIHIRFSLTVWHSLWILQVLTFISSKVIPNCSRALRGATPCITISDCGSVGIASSWLIACMLCHVMGGTVGWCDLGTLPICLLLTLSYAQAARAVLATIIEWSLLLFLLLLQILALLSLEIDELSRQLLVVLVQYLFQYDVLCMA